jgi:protein phosphatase
MAMFEIASSGLSDIGRKRFTNQDCFLLDKDHHLYVVADGMGGHQAGEVAAQLVVDSIRRYFTAWSSSHPLLENDPADSSLSAAANRLLGAIRYASQQVYQASVSQSAYKGMGSTLAAVLFTDNTFVAANVGDSPIYLIHEGAIEMLSVPHTLMAAQADLSPDLDVFGPQLGHMLTRGMGIEETVQPDICESPCFSGDRLVICSDGLSGLVAPGEILEAVASQSAPEACQSLVELANRRGGEDNITVIVLHVDKPKQLLLRLGHWVSRFTGGGLAEG